MQEEEAHNSCKTVFCEEQVAEDALLSIGAVLQWELHDSDGIRAFLVTTDSALYACAPSKKEKLFVALSHCDGEGLVPRLYTTMAEAKAACEIHAVTGQFPPGVEVVEST